MKDSKIGRGGTDGIRLEDSAEEESRRQRFKFVNFVLLSLYVKVRDLLIASSKPTNPLFFEQTDEWARPIILVRIYADGNLHIIQT